MAAEAAEAKLTELLRDQVAKVEKQCIRPLHVSFCIWNDFVHFRPQSGPEKLLCVALGGSFSVQCQLLQGSTELFRSGATLLNWMHAGS